MVKKKIDERFLGCSTLKNNISYRNMLLPTFMPRQNTNNSGKCFRKRPRRIQLTTITSSCPLSDLLMLLVSALMLP